MREIKFRAWMKKEKKMVPVHSLNFSEEEEEPVEVSYCGDVNCRMCPDPRRRDEVVLMQYTGLKDKNGKEVYEGDVVRCSRGCPHEVYFEKECGGTYVGGMPAFYLKGMNNGYAWTGSEEVIGNIHENPELLEVKE